MKFILLTLALLATEVSYGWSDPIIRKCEGCEDLLRACVIERMDWKVRVRICREKLQKEKEAIIAEGESRKNYYRCKLNFLEEKKWPRDSVIRLTRLLDSDLFGGLNYSRKKLNEAMCIVSSKIIRRPNMMPSSCAGCWKTHSRCRDDVSDLLSRYTWCYNDLDDIDKSMRKHIERIRHIMSCNLKHLITVLPEGQKAIELTFSEDTRRLDKKAFPECMPLTGTQLKARRCVADGGTPFFHHLDGRPGPYRVTCVMPKKKEGN